MATRKEIPSLTREEMLLQIPSLASEVRKLERRLEPGWTAAEIDEALFDIQYRLDGLKKQAGYKTSSR